MERHSGFILLSGNGVQRTFLIPHGCSFKPYFISAEASSVDALGITLDSTSTPCVTHSKAYVITATSTNIEVRYEEAPITGTDNLGFYWSAESN